jgi:hypothetical protein
MKKSILIFCAAVITGSIGLAADHDPNAIFALLKDSKTTLLEAIVYAEANSGPATSAKFEVDDGKLMVSIYTIPEGLSVEPEKATLTELAGPASEGTQNLKADVFTDKEHIARASVHLTLLQLSRLNLKQILQIAVKRKPGTVIDIRNPMVRNKRPVADVILIDEDQRPATVTVDLLSGKSKLQK